MSVYVLVRNIPSLYHSVDLRNFFSQFVESSCFDCFHFRHRPDVQKQLNDDVKSISEAVRQPEKLAQCRKTFCCVVKVKSSKVERFIKNYNKKHWVDKHGNMMRLKCFIAPVKIVNDLDPENRSEICVQPERIQNKLATNTVLPYSQSRLSEGIAGRTNHQETSVRAQDPENNCEVKSSDLEKLIELKPPNLMPNGNVGTQTHHFLKLINSCLLPSYLIKKLGLIFPKTRSNKIYGSVPYDYGKTIVPSDGKGEDVSIKTSSGRSLSETFVHTDFKRDKPEGVDQLVEEVECNEDDDIGEEWDRHESLHNDVTTQERTKERLYEEEIELKWEKGGSGLVFYTDAQFWDQQEGDFDEKTTDDYDVDMSGYYENVAGDKDSRDLIEMNREKKIRIGELTDDCRLGSFEKHTKGIGRRLMEKHGWKDGKGLGCSVEGIAHALDNEGQHPKDKKGLGYRGEKLVRFMSRKRRNPEDVIISTVYDDPVDIDGPESLFRSHPPTSIKRISNYSCNAFVKFKSPSQFN